MSDFEIRYDRRVSDDLLAHFRPKGVAASLTRMVTKRALYPLDLQFRRSPKSGAEHATLYTGLTAVLNLHRTKDGLKLSGHQTWTGKGHGFDQDWRKTAPVDTWRERWHDVELYLERVIPVATKNHGVTEGAVQAAVSSGTSRKRVMLDREVVPHFRDKKTKERMLRDCRRPILDVLHRHDFGPGKVPTNFGAECDLLALEASGEVLAIEVKPLAGGGVPWVAAQATMYARVLQTWIDEDGHALAREVLGDTLRQRRELGLCPKTDVTLPGRLSVRPVVALQRGATQKLKDRMLAVRDALNAADLGVPDVRVYEVSITGDLKELAG
ncbi:hypothetical protein [Nocardioides coralli]|uniref:hypothetical protein n=1 Tax=Nocardioides coralli TaxID=2872154 RepID=UPI001CA3C850|nr:hypothetical protein [Nocardioides coralli]QZY29696.1 hypothetical protein K6T13_03105 [Nocardioides coralli]